MKIFRNYINILYLSLLLVSFGYSGYGQIAMGSNTVPNPNTDLILGSANKGVLLNRVKLQSITSAAPLDVLHIKPGMLVYNTNVTTDLQEGLYYWTSKNNWSRMYVKSSPTREMNQIGFKETSKEYSVPYSTSSTPAFVNIDQLDFDYVATMSGDVFIELTVYAFFAENTSPKAGNTYCYTTVVDNTGKEVFKGITAISPYTLSSNEGLMPTQGYSNFVFTVEKGKTYHIKTTANETYASGWAVFLGDYTLAGNKLHSSIKVTFLSEPKL